VVIADFVISTSNNKLGQDRKDNTRYSYYDSYYIVPGYQNPKNKFAACLVVHTWIEMLATTILLYLFFIGPTCGPTTLLQVGPCIVIDLL